MTLYFLLCKGDVLLTREGRIPLTVPPVGLQPWNRVTAFKVGDRQCEVYRLDAPPTGLEGYRMLPLRQTHALLSPEEYQLAGKCQELVYWDGNSRFCGCCGSPMQWSSPISKHCTGCGKELWPQLAVAVIARVTRGEEILLVQAKSFRTDFYGLVSGFVETGETLEQCVEREVLEETGLSVRSIRYFGSQPWPFPCGLMVGFTAEYAEGELRLQRSELSRGGWFKRGSLPRVPDEASIARWLIDDYLKG